MLKTTACAPRPPPSLPKLLASQGVETVKSFCDNPARPKVSLQGWNAAMHPYEFEPGTVNLTFAKCLVQVASSLIRAKLRPKTGWAQVDWSTRNCAPCWML